MNKQQEALKLALEALERVNANPSLEDWHHAFDEEVVAIREALADSALDRMAENARELGIQMQPEQKPIARLQWADGWTVTLLTGAEDIPSRSGPYALYVGPAPEQPAQQHIEHCLWARNGNQPCPHVQPAQQEEIEELTNQRDFLADILTRTANALKGQPAELSAHSWHNLPEVAQRLKAEQQQEPVATVTNESGNPNVAMSWWHEPALPVGTKLYTSPPVSKREDK